MTIDEDRVPEPGQLNVDGVDELDELPVFPGFREVARNQRSLVTRLVAHRQELGLSQTEVAARMGTSQSAVARLERADGDLRLSTLDRYAAALGQELGFGLAARVSGKALGRDVEEGRS